MSSAVDWSTLVHNLDGFNRKERFALVNHALGTAQFTPSFSFVSQLLGVTETSVSHPSQVVCWMDYHLDWIYAALEISKPEGGSEGPFPLPEKWALSANQEDVDLLLAVHPRTSGEPIHLFLVEAKWESGWSTAQMASKAQRLNGIFGPDGARYTGVQPHLVLASSAVPKHLRAKLKALDEDPVRPWMVMNDDAFAWLPLSVPAGRQRIKTTSEGWLVDCAPVPEV